MGVLISSIVDFWGFFNRFLGYMGSWALIKTRDDEKYRIVLF